MRESERERERKWKLWVNERRIMKHLHIVRIILNEIRCQCIACIQNVTVRVCTSAFFCCKSPCYTLIFLHVNIATLHERSRAFSHKMLLYIHVKHFTWIKTWVLFSHTISLQVHMRLKIQRSVNIFTISVAADIDAVVRFLTLSICLSVCLLKSLFSVRLHFILSSCELFVWIDLSIYQYTHKKVSSQLFVLRRNFSL